MGLFELIPSLVDWAWTFVQPEYELLRLAKKGDHAAVAAYLLQHSTEQVQAAANYIDAAGRSPLVVVCREGHVECLHMMLQHPIFHAMFPAYADGNGNTLLHHACFQGQAEVVRSLVLARIDDDIAFNSKQKIFNSKQFAFSLPCRKKAVAAPVTDVHGFNALASMEFAAVDADGYDSWSHFFVVGAHRHNSPGRSLALRPPPHEAVALAAPSAPSMESIHFEEVVKPAVAPPPPSGDECVVCFDGPIEAVCVPCGHHVMCMDCANAVMGAGGECPVCRATLCQVIKLFRA
ncbi:hypothetical protein DYB26_009078 [Aphanomyces astaci]|uniref:RING-type domain-containing protein n=1 Tax=Aphanomyces astaci TaxID=112090 RepID=A0A3R7BZR4_APHAT|nr:hypothetical protein DYB26_009078 [Aphanomyces astaci]